MEFNLCDRFEFAGGGWLQVHIHRERTAGLYVMAIRNDDMSMTGAWDTLAECLASLAAWVAKGEAGGFAS